MTQDDLPAVTAIAARVHPEFFEEEAVFVERQRLYGAGTHLLEKGGIASGYILSHPWRLGSLPALNSRLGQLPADPDTLYIHDLALLPAARGTGAAGQIVEQVIAHARQAGLPCLSLVAVNGSIPFWTRLGFAVQERPELASKLRSYEAAAQWMVCRL